MTDGHASQRLQDSVHQRVRLGVMALLAADDRVAFTTLAQSLRQSNGSLSQHIGVLEQAGFVALDKGYEGRRPRTWVSLTAEGRRALEREVAALEELMGEFAEAGVSSDTYALSHKQAISALFAIALVLGRDGTSTSEEKREEALAGLRSLMMQLDLPRVASGKVREMFDAGEHLLMVATDRISVFDVVLPTPIPDKGTVLTGLSSFWFDHTAKLVPNHMVEWVRGGPWPADALGRSMLVRRADMLAVECVVRGYLAGSGWKDYQKSGVVCGVQLPPGLRESDELPEPIFTPSTKAQTGHDENIDLDTAKRIVGDAALVDRVARVSIELYESARAHARDRGIILADTKFEFGLVAGELTLCDEAFTPDSSRYWPVDEWQPGQAPPSFDKQYVRDYTEALGWDKAYPGPELPKDVVAGTTRRYREAFERVSGRSLDEALET